MLAKILSQSPPRPPPCLKSAFCLAVSSSNEVDWGGGGVRRGSVYFYIGTGTYRNSFVFYQIFFTVSFLPIFFSNYLLTSKKQPILAKRTRIYIEKKVRTEQVKNIYNPFLSKVFHSRKTCNAKIWHISWNRPFQYMSNMLKSSTIEATNMPFPGGRGAANALHEWGNGCDHRGSRTSCFLR